MAVLSAQQKSYTDPSQFHIDSLGFGRQLPGSGLDKEVVHYRNARCLENIVEQNGSSQRPDRK